MMEFDKLREQWRRAFSPISSRELDMWSKDLKSELKSIPYIRLVKETTGGFLNMLDFKMVLNVDGVNLQMLRGDLGRVWSNGIAAGMRVGYTFRETDTGLRFFFAALTNNNNFITGVVTVVRKEAL